MAYRKVCDSQGGPMVSDVLNCSGALDLAWEMKKEELQEPGNSLDHMQMQHVDCQHSSRSNTGPDPDPELMEPIQPPVSVSPHGRFERLQEDPNYISHFTRASGHKGQRHRHCLLFRYFIAAVGMFVLGLLIGWFAHNPPAKAKRLTSDSSDLLEELLKRISPDKIDALHRSFSILPDDSEEARARYLHSQWVGLGLTGVYLQNHTVLVSLPGSSPNTITDSSSNQCFQPNGTPCDQPGSPDMAYAAYSAVGTIKGVVVDVQYATEADLRRARESVNITGQIAVVKLGQAPLLYKLSLLSEMGFGGVLLYLDPCDAPPGRHIFHQAFSVTLNPGGNPTAGSQTNQLHLTSLLVQPISAFLAKTLLSSPSTGQGDHCTPLAMPAKAERRKITLNIGNQWSTKKIYNVVGYLKGRKNPDRQVLVGSHHDNSEGGGASAIMNQLIAALTEQTKQGWVPDRTTVFCSWGGSAVGNIGSYEWGKVNSVVLQSCAVAYISLNSPVRGTETLRATACPTLLQLTSDIQRRQLLSCIRGGNCPGPSVSTLQSPGDKSFVANMLGVPTMEFAFEQAKAETTTFLSEALFPAESPRTIDPLFKFHETIAKMTMEAIFRLVTDPVLPFYPLDIALDVQDKLRDEKAASPALLSAAASLRDHAAFFQSEMMRPANDPKERDPSHVRMLNDVLRDLEKSFLVPQSPPGVYRNLLYRLPGQTAQFSLMRLSQDAPWHCNNATTSVCRPVAEQGGACLYSISHSRSLILEAVRSADTLVCFGLELFENYPL
ncbi:inactive N-acetylated-alpha-linked acidic dipeptidase-like protein 2 isoform X1 [Synchiropus splendidus]|uniref:inactive N-acetylated-alpha-linked acidic dipeptidase-like protein 2 isoform X1 n=1 Tax=Synchiropus splendidus TaxID=270530 RepID=UPI00237DC21F|nr:inactive N-acetylated-alpha-linked acidic dipeptidase-like protein 2 isoform X1 [Synchiropus splendidus]XP_053708525.1 inactive N-acetylated-alpha-linked acidic dipeptidase-like protein 2 isoform X1 [Synchiropus splendidus]XP_053708536.1 inactive N-acetylated-alpha-linked acidic dipeptidase-like protein 2 isoform X1 [Synchiropus splendidus]